MTFIRKLATYLLGVGLGVVLVYFIFGDRDIQCNYFPNDRVLYDLRKKDISVSPEAHKVLVNHNLPDSLWVWALERSDVDFENSRPREEPCGFYYLEMQDPPCRIRVENCDSVANFQHLEIVH